MRPPFRVAVCLYSHLLVPPDPSILPSPPTASTATHHCRPLRPAQCCKLGAALLQPTLPSSASSAPLLCVRCDLHIIYHCVTGPQRQPNWIQVAVPDTGREGGEAQERRNTGQNSGVPKKAWWTDGGRGTAAEAGPGAEFKEDRMFAKRIRTRRRPGRPAGYPGRARCNHGPGPQKLGAALVIGWSAASQAAAARGALSRRTRGTRAARAGGWQGSQVGWLVGCWAGSSVSSGSVSRLRALCTGMRVPCLPSLVFQANPLPPTCEGSVSQSCTRFCGRQGRGGRGARERHVVMWARRLCWQDGAALLASTCSAAGGSKCVAQGRSLLQPVKSGKATLLRWLPQPPAHPAAMPASRHRCIQQHAAAQQGCKYASAGSKRMAAAWGGCQGCGAWPSC